MYTYMFLFTTGQQVRLGACMHAQMAHTWYKLTSRIISYRCANLKCLAGSLDDYMYAEIFVGDTLCAYNNYDYGSSFAILSLSRYMYH
jgi:hypothetical protein